MRQEGHSDPVFDIMPGRLYISFGHQKIRITIIRKSGVECCNPRYNIHRFFIWQSNTRSKSCQKVAALVSAYYSNCKGHVPKQREFEHYNRRADKHDDHKYHTALTPSLESTHLKVSMLHSYLSSNLREAATKIEERAEKGLHEKSYVLLTMGAQIACFF